MRTSAATAAPPEPDSAKERFRWPVRDSAESKREQGRRRGREEKPVPGGLNREREEKRAARIYIRQHLFFLFFLTCSAALVAISNTSRTPSLVLAEHSR